MGVCKADRLCFVSCELRLKKQLTVLVEQSSISKVHPCTGTEALYRPYGP